MLNLLQTCIPTLRNIFVKECEGGAGSPDKTYLLGAENNYWPGTLKDFISRVVFVRLSEGSERTDKLNKRNEVKPVPVPKRPWEGYPKDKCLDYQRTSRVMTAGVFFVLIHFFSPVSRALTSSLIFQK